MNVKMNNKSRKIPTYSHWGWESLVDALFLRLPTGHRDPQTPGRLKRPDRCPHGALRWNTRDRILGKWRAVLTLSSGAGWLFASDMRDFPESPCDCAPLVRAAPSEEEEEEAGEGRRACGAAPEAAAQF